MCMSMEFVHQIHTVGAISQVKFMPCVKHMTKSPGFTHFCTCLTHYLSLKPVAKLASQLRFYSMCYAAMLRLSHAIIFQEKNVFSQILLQNSHL